MHCPDCQLEYESNPKADVQVCPHCRFAAKMGNGNRRVPKLDDLTANQDSPEPKIRIDDSHVARPTFLSDDRSVLNSTGNWLAVRSLSHISVFGLLVFLVGQGNFDLGLPCWPLFSMEFGQFDVAGRYHGINTLRYYHNQEV